jgi:hypothetical protein
MMLIFFSLIIFYAINRDAEMSTCVYRQELAKWKIMQYDNRDLPAQNSSKMTAFSLVLKQYQNNPWW